MGWDCHLHGTRVWQCHSPSCMKGGSAKHNRGEGGSIHFFPPFLTSSSLSHYLAPRTREARTAEAIWEQGRRMGRKGVWTGKRREAAAGRAREAAGSPARSRPREDTGCPGTLRTEPKTPGPAQQGESPRHSEGRHPAAPGRAHGLALSSLSDKWVGMIA